MDLVERGTDGPRQGSRAERVVDVVQPRNAELDATRSVGRDQVERDTVDPAELDLAGDDVERGAGMAAGGAAVVAEVADVGRRILVRRSAPDAPDRIGGVLQLGVGLARIVDAEHGSLRPIALSTEISDLGIVAVDHERRIGGERLHRRPPAIGDELELAVAVELVAEEIAEADRPRPQPPGNLGQRGFVDLEEAELCGARGKQGGRDAGHEVCAGAVVREPELPSQDPRGHRRRRRLAVCRRDKRGTERKPTSELVDCRRIELPEQLAGNGRAAPGASQAREASCGACEKDLQLQGKAGSQSPQTLSEDVAGAGDDPAGGTPSNGGSSRCPEKGGCPLVGRPVACQVVIDLRRSRARHAGLCNRGTA